MSKLQSRHIFTSESVSEGHPDKVADLISDAVLDACLALDSRAHVACETVCGPDLVVNVGELSLDNREKLDSEAVAREVVKGIGYDRPEEGFSFDTFKYINALNQQSSDIAQGVNRGAPEEQGAGDQGMMFGYATNETPELMPAPLVFSHRLVYRFAKLRKEGKLSYLRPDSKAQVSVLYDKGHPVSIQSIVVSHQTEDVPIETIRRDIRDYSHEWLKGTGLLTNDTEYFINPTGRFVIGGPAGDSGLTGRKIVVDSYGGVASHGGGAFSGKDPSKVDRSATYYARYVAKNIVAAGLADKCEVEVAYAIGVAKPVSICVYTYGTSGLPEEKLADIVANSGIFDFRPGMIIRNLGLLKPEGWCYRDTCNYGHFGRSIFPWEKTDKIEALRAACGK